MDEDENEESVNKGIKKKPPVQMHFMNNATLQPRKSGYPEPCPLCGSLLYHRKLGKRRNCHFCKSIKSRAINIKWKRERGKLTREIRNLERELQDRKERLEIVNKEFEEEMELAIEEEARAHEEEWGILPKEVRDIADQVAGGDDLSDPGEAEQEAKGQGEESECPEESNCDLCNNTDCPGSPGEEAEIEPESKDGGQRNPHLPIPREFSKNYPGEWLVIRHSGNYSATWRIVFHGSEGTAREKFTAISLKLKRGAVVVLDQLGETQNQTFSIKKKELKGV